MQDAQVKKICTLHNSPETAKEPKAVAHKTSDYKAIVKHAQDFAMTGSKIIRGWSMVDMSHMTCKTCIATPSQKAVHNLDILCLSDQC